MMVQESLLRRVITSPYLALALRIYLGAVFIYASMAKITYTGEFAENIASYQILPYWGVNLFAIILPWTELICGTLLVFGVRSKAAVLMIAVMLVMFTVAIFASLLRGIPIGCGCFHSLEEPMTWTTLLRDLVWLVMARQVYRFDSVLQLERYFQLNIRDDPIV